MDTTENNEETCAECTVAELNEQIEVLEDKLFEAKKNGFVWSGIMLLAGYVLGVLVQYFAS